MKTLAQIVVLMLISYTAYAQQLEGNWTGTLQVQGTPLRVIFHVTRTGDKYETTMDSPDQNATGIKVTVTSFNFPQVKFEVANAGAVYEGVMSGQSVTGKWIQSGTALFLQLLRSDAPETPKR